MFLSVYIVFTGPQYVDAGVFPASGHLENLLPFPVELEDRPNIQEVYPLVPEGLPMLRMLKRHSKAYPPPLNTSNPVVSLHQPNVRLPTASAMKAIKKLNPIASSDSPEISGPRPPRTNIDLPDHTSVFGLKMDPVEGIPSGAPPPVASETVDPDIVHIPRSVLSGILDRVTQLQGRVNAQHLRDQEAVARSSETVLGYQELLNLAMNVAPDYPFQPAQPDFQTRKMTSQSKQLKDQKSTGRP